MTASAEGPVSAVAIEPEIYSWHERQWARLAGNPARLPHALVLHGQAGLGKNAFALRLARFLLCREHRSNRDACGVCQSCLLFRAGNHPDLMRIGLEDDAGNILVDQIRVVIDFFSLKPHIASRKIVIISPAEAMNVSAANSLLKILEEPPPGSLLLLSTSHLSRLSMTVRSRCVRVAFPVPPRSDALAWLRSQSLAAEESEVLLKFAGGAPLAALGSARANHAAIWTQLSSDLAALAGQRHDPVGCAERWKTTGAETCLDWLHRFTIGAVRTQLGSESGVSAAVVSIPVGNKVFSINSMELFNFIDKLCQSKRYLGTGVDETLILEELLIDWCEMTSGAG